MIKEFLLPILAVVLLAGCVNLHVHFPDASGKQADSGQSRETGGAAQ